MNRVCGSGLQAVVHAVEAIRVGYVDTMMAGSTDRLCGGGGAGGTAPARACSVVSANGGGCQVTVRPSIMLAAKPVR